MARIFETLTQFESSHRFYSILVTCYNRDHSAVEMEAIILKNQIHTTRHRQMFGFWIPASRKQEQNIRAGCLQQGGDQLDIRALLLAGLKDLICGEEMSSDSGVLAG